MKVKDLLFNELQGPFSKKKKPKTAKAIARMHSVKSQPTQGRAGCGEGHCLPESPTLGSTAYSHSLSPGPGNTSVVTLGQAGLRIYSQIVS